MHFIPNLTNNCVFLHRRLGRVGGDEVEHFVHHMRREVANVADDMHTKNVQELQDMDADETWVEQVQQQVKACRRDSKRPHPIPPE